MPQETLTNSCKIAPQTPADRASTRAELAEWCNNLAREMGVLSLKKPVYYCTEANFGTDTTGPDPTESSKAANAGGSQ